MSDLVGNPKDRFSHCVVHIILSVEQGAKVVVFDIEGQHIYYILSNNSLIINDLVLFSSPQLQTFLN